MPTYEYRCPKGHAFDVFQKMSDPAGATCPECGEAAERQISAGAGFIFKGEGFYITDYRSKDYKEKASREQPTGDAGDTKKANSEGSASTSPEKPAADKPAAAEAPKKKASSGGAE